MKKKSKKFTWMKNGIPTSFAQETLLRCNYFSNKLYNKSIFSDTLSTIEQDAIADLVLQQSTYHPEMNLNDSFKMRAQITLMSKSPNSGFGKPNDYKYRDIIKQAAITYGQAV